MALVNEQSRSESAALGDVNMRSLQKGDVIQLERKGYYKVRSQSSNRICSLFKSMK